MAPRRRSSRAARSEPSASTRGTADRENPVRGGGNLDAMRGHLRPPGDVREVEDPPAWAGDHERSLDPDLSQEAGQLGEPPADDHARRGRANWRNARAARVSD